MRIENSVRVAWVAPALVAIGCSGEDPCECTADSSPPPLRSYLGNTSKKFSGELIEPGQCDDNSEACTVDAWCGAGNPQPLCLNVGPDHGAGYGDADKLCAVVSPGAVVCSKLEILESIRSGSVGPPEAAWVVGGSYDCRAWDPTHGSPSGEPDGYGTIWRPTGPLDVPCGDSFPFACCE